MKGFGSFGRLHVDHWTNKLKVNKLLEVTEDKGIRFGDTITLRINNNRLSIRPGTDITEGSNIDADGNAVFYGTIEAGTTIKTGNPGAGNVGWLLGNIIGENTYSFDTTQAVEVEIDGQHCYLALANIV